PGDLTFSELGHDEASMAAQSLFRALREWAAGGTGAVEVRQGGESDHRLVAIIGPYTLLACGRVPGPPHTPLVCGEDEANRTRGALTQLLCPGEAAEQEVYFNTRFFERLE